MMDQYSSLPPMPTVEITIEQQFKLRKMKDLMENCPKDQLVEVFLEVQKHNFILTNNISQILSAWLDSPHPTTPEDQQKFGIL